jgi:hypothetical protein
MSWVVFVGELGELRTVPSAIGERMVKLSWMARIKNGAKVSPGDKLAIVFWASGRTEHLVAPNGCSGSISASNRRIDFPNLRRAPSQWLIRL